MVRERVRTTAGAVSAVEHLGAQAGARMLRAGGNAADAAVACCFAQTVVDPWRCSISGAASIMYHDGATGTTTFIDAGGHAPRRASDTMFEVVTRWENAFVVKDGINRWGYLAQTVPGFIRGMHVLHEKFGSGVLGWSDLITPALDFAAEGFAVHPHLARAWQPGSGDTNPIFGDSYKALSFSPESRRLFLHADGSVYRAGETLRQQDLANTLTLISERGPDEFYEGEIAARVVEDFKNNGGLIDATDLKDYQPHLEEPISAPYRDFDLVTQSAPSVGPTILQILGVLDGWDIAACGWNSPTHLRRLADTIYLAFIDRDEHIGDPRVVGDTFRQLLRPEHITKLRESIEAGEAVDRDTVTSGEAPHDTTHVATMDQFGNACGVTHSVGAGTGVITPGLGFMHNCHMTNYDPRPGMVNSIAPHKRGTGGGAPVILFRDGRPVMSLGSPAGTYKASAIPQVISNRVDFDMTLSQAVSADRIHVRSSPRTAVLDDRFDPRAALVLAEHGYPLTFSNYSARVVGVERDPSSGEFSTGSDVRGDRGEEVVLAD